MYAVRNIWAPDIAPIAGRQHLLAGNREKSLNILDTQVLRRIRSTSVNARQGMDLHRKSCMASVDGLLHGREKRYVPGLGRSESRADNNFADRMIADTTWYFVHRVSGVHIRYGILLVPEDLMGSDAIRAWSCSAVLGEEHSLST